MLLLARQHRSFDGSTVEQISHNSNRIRTLARAPRVLPLTRVLLLHLLVRAFTSFAIARTPADTYPSPSSSSSSFSLQDAEKTRRRPRASLPLDRDSSSSSSSSTSRVVSLFHQNRRSGNRCPSSGHLPQTALRKTPQTTRKPSFSLLTSAWPQPPLSHCETWPGPMVSTRSPQRPSAEMSRGQSLG